MKRATQALLAGAGAAAAFYAVRTLSRKHSNTLPSVDDKKRAYSMEPVEVASEDSFPASDPPAWTGTTGPIGKT
jgi:hypothetical protein